MENDRFYGRIHGKKLNKIQDKIEEKKNGEGLTVSGNILFT